MASPLINVQLNGLQIKAHGEYTANEVGTFFDQYWRNIVGFYTGTTDENGNFLPDQLDDPEQAALNLWLNLSALVDGAQNGIDSATGLPVPAGQEPQGRRFYFTVEMVNSLDRLLKSVEASGLTVEALFGSTPLTAPEILAKFQTWFDLAEINVREILADMGEAIRSNRTLQALIEVEYVKVGNEMIGNQLDELDEALNITKAVMDLLTIVQDLKNLITPDEKTKAQIYFQGIGDPDGDYTGGDPSDNDQLADYTNDPDIVALDPDGDNIDQPPDENGVIYDGRDVNSGTALPDDVTGPFEAVMRKAFDLPIGVNFSLVKPEDVERFANVRTRLAGLIGRLYTIFDLDPLADIDEADKPPLINKLETLLSDMSPSQVTMDAISYVTVILNPDQYDPDDVRAHYPNLVATNTSSNHTLNIDGNSTDISGWTVYRLYFPTGSNWTSQAAGFMGDPENVVIRIPDDAQGNAITDTIGTNDYYNEFQTLVADFNSERDDVDDLLELPLVDRALAFNQINSQRNDFIDQINKFNALATKFNTQFGASIPLYPLPPSTEDMVDDGEDALDGFEAIDFQDFFDQYLDPEIDNENIEIDNGFIYGENNLELLNSMLSTGGTAGSEFLNLITINKSENNNQSFNVDVALIPPEFNPTRLAFQRWLADNYPNADVVDAGVFQRHVTEAITAAQNLNDTQKEDLRRFMYLFEQFYKSATALLQAIDRMVNRMAQNIKG